VSVDRKFGIKIAARKTLT